MKKITIYLLAVLPFISCNESDLPTTKKELEKEIIWSKTYGGSEDDETTGVVATPDGGVIVIGHSKSTDGDVTKLYAETDIWVTKIDSNGNIVWNKIIGGSLNDYAISIIKTKDNNYVIAGYSGSSDYDLPRNLGQHDFMIMKINENGSILWTKTYGFIGHDHAHKIIQTKDGGLFVAGFADYSGLIGQPSNGEGHILHRGKAPMHGVGEYLGMKLTASGDFEWYRYFGGTQNDRVTDVVEGDDGSILMAGYSESNDFDFVGGKGSYDYWVVNLSKEGHLHWKKNFGGSDIDQAYGIVKTDSNSYILVGQSNSTDGDISNPKGNSDVWVVHFDQHGHLIWEKSFGGTAFETALSIKKVGYNNFTVLGHSRSETTDFVNKGQNDIYLFSIDIHANSSVIWQKTLGGSEFDLGYDFAQTSDNSYILVGVTNSINGDFLLNKGKNDRFVVKVK